MKKLSKLKLKEFHEMSDSEMKYVVGGYSDGSDPTPSRCDENKGCKKNSDCSSSQVCSKMSDCTSIAIYGQYRCF